MTTIRVEPKTLKSQEGHPPSDKTLTGFVSGDRRISAEQMTNRVARAATVLERHGVTPNDHVAVMLRNDFAFFEASYATQTLGAVAVPINWHYKGNEVGFILRDSAANVLVIHADLLGQIEGRVPDGCVVLVVDTPPEIAAAYGCQSATAPAGSSWNAAVESAQPWQGEPRAAAPSMIYTSGTTGKPKGVRRFAPLNPAHPAMTGVVNALGVAPGMRTVMCGPMYHTAPNVYGLLAGRLGDLVVLQPKFDAEELLALVERYAIDSLHLVPTMMVRLLALDANVRASYDISTLKCIAHGAAPCPPAVKRATIEWLGPIVNEYYGGTESAIVTACNSEEWLAHAGTVGKVTAGSVVKILDADGSELPRGEVGDVYVWNPGYGDFTYHDRDDDRAAIEKDGLVTIGDIGYLDDDGYLFLCDRRKDVIISGGVNIYTAEIEAELIQHPDVADCAVFGIPDDEFGESVAAAVQLRDGAVGDVDGIRAFLDERLASFKVPRTIEFGELPREDSGKVFKQKLRARYWPEGKAI
ncbi:AMP-binding protein [Mycobacterium sp. URHB0021]